MDKSQYVRLSSTLQLMDSGSKNLAFWPNSENKIHMSIQTMIQIHLHLVLDLLDILRRRCQIP